MRKARELLALGADVLTVAAGGGLLISALAAVVLLWTKIAPVPLLAVLLLGIFLISAGVTGRLWYERTERRIAKPVAPTHSLGLESTVSGAGSGPVKLRRELADNLEAIREFYAEVEKIAGPRPAGPASGEDAVTVDLFRIATERLGDLPLRHHELLAIVHVLREAINNLDDLPFSGNDAADIQFRTEWRTDTQIWYLPLTTAKAYGGGVIRSDETLSTLTEFHKRLLALRREV